MPLPLADACVRAVKMGPQIGLSDPEKRSECSMPALIGEAWAAALVLRPTTPFLRLLKGDKANYEIIASQLRNDYGSVSSSAVLRR